MATVSACTAVVSNHDDDKVRRLRRIKALWQILVVVSEYTPELVVGAAKTLEAQNLFPSTNRMSPDFIATNKVLARVTELERVLPK